MAPTTNKRAQVHQTAIKENTHMPHGFGSGTHTHTKENTNNTKHSKKGLEILDFHESWLEEMEIYKDKLYLQKHHLQLLGTHNHAHTPQGCHLETSNVLVPPPPPHVGSLVNFETISSTNDTNNKKKTTVSKAKSIYSKPPTESVITSPPRSVPTEAKPISNNAAGAATINNQLLLKRAREELANSKPNPSNTAAYKRPSNAHTFAHNLTPANTAVKNGLSLGSGTNPMQSSITGAKTPTKIVVNQFHASSLLHSQHHDEKTKILTLNGLTKSAATAYETSLYASNYLPQDQRHGTGRPTYADYNTYVGVSFAKSGDDKHHGRYEDDPCAAIDDVNDYSDSESDEEYTGYPFYLEGDSGQTHQSRHIRYYSDGGNEPLNSEANSESERSEYYRPNCILTPSLFPNVPPFLNFSSHAEKGPPMPTALHKILKWKLSPVMPKIVKRVVLNSGFRIIKNTTDWMAVWEKHMKSPGFRTIRSHQKYNHMPGSFRIGRKDTMWRSIHNNMKKFGCKEFGFMQRSYVMPDDLENLRQVWPKNASKLTKWIVKPPASARGTGIRIVNKWSQFPKDRPLVVQKYIERPLLINDNKFDMRIYVVVTSINPLRIYMYKDGLARFASVKYSSEITSLDERCMHLTNYSINKFSQNYSKNEDFNAAQGHKWTLQSLWACLEKRGINTKTLWATLRNLVIKAIISGESGLNRMYRQNVNFRYNCFELFGFDILLDENLIPWLLEINISPSLHSELPLDLHVKGPLIQAVLNTALYQVPPKLTEKQQKEILEELELKGPLCYDKRLFTTCLTAEEVRKHNQFTNRSIEFREEYLDAILENLLPDDIRCLVIAEDEFARSKPLERVFPTPDTHIYLKYVDNPRYYNRLLDAWEHKYGHCRAAGLKRLKRYCEEGYHLQVSDAAMEKEPNVTLTDIDMLHTKRSDDHLIMSMNPDKPITPPINLNTNNNNSTNTTNSNINDDGPSAERHSK